MIRSHASTDKPIKYTLASAVLVGTFVSVFAVGISSLFSHSSTAAQATSPIQIAKSRTTLALQLPSAPLTATSHDHTEDVDSETADFAEIYVESADRSSDLYVFEEDLENTNLADDALHESQGSAPRFAIASDRRDWPQVAIIIDDLGHSRQHSEGALALPKQIAFAVLPYGQHAGSLARKAAADGHELIVHMPMEPHSHKQDPGPNVLTTQVTEAQLRKTIAWNLSQFDGYFAVNNHMGSHFTENRAAMAVLFDELSKRDLAFFDSRTTAASQSVDLAASLSVPFAERDVFLDNEQNVSAVERQLATLERLARRNGTAIAIGHPHSETFAAISAWATTLEEKGISLAAPSAIVSRRETPFWRRMVRGGQKSSVKVAQVESFEQPAERDLK